MTKVLKETADLRLVDGGDWAKVDALPADWPSHGYQEIVHADGAPSEAVVTLRMAAAGAELVRAADESLAARAGQLRTETLDGEDAPNTAPERYEGWTPETEGDAEVERLANRPPSTAARRAAVSRRRRAARPRR